MEVLEGEHRALIARRRIWSDSLEAIIHALPPRAALVSIRQETGRLTIEGRAGSPAIALDKIGDFSGVRIAQLALADSVDRPTEVIFTIIVER